MAGLRHFSRLHRRWLTLAIVLALAVRVAVPAGWMPVAGPAGVVLGLCDGASMAADMMAPMTMAPGMKMPATQAGEDRARRAGVPMHHQGAPDHPCAFAGAAASVDMPVLAAPAPALHAIVAAPPVVAALVAPGRGLAAPPPPSHAPPAFRA